MKWLHYMNAVEAQRWAEIKAEQSALSLEKRRLRIRCVKRMERDKA